MLNLQRNASFDSEIEAVIMKERASEKERERERDVEGGMKVQYCGLVCGSSGRETLLHFP